MRDLSEEEEEFIQDLSESLNNKWLFEDIRNLAQGHLNIHLDSNDDVWHRIELAILETIIDWEDEQC